MTTIDIRPATIEEIPTIAYHRRRMFAEMGVGDEAGHEKMTIAFAAWAQRTMQAGEFFTWFACDGDTVVGGAGLLLLDWPPAPDGDVGRRGYVYNVFVEPGYRRQGIARRLMDAALDFARQQGIRRVRLHASEAGRALYVSMGFTPTNEMGIELLEE